MPAHRKRCKRYHVQGHAHFLTFSCFHRLPLLSRDRSRHWLIDAIDSFRNRGDFDLWAYVIMPEHVHLVVLPREPATPSSILKSIKKSVSNVAIHWLRENEPTFLKTLADVRPTGQPSYRFWQRGGGYDRNLFGPTEVHEKITYVHENPVRRGLVDRPVQWRWSSALAWERGVDDPIAIDRESVPVLDW